MPFRRRVSLSLLTACLIALVAACGSSLGSGPPANSGASPSAGGGASPQATAPERLCALFREIQQASAASGGVLASKEDWNRRIAWTEQILAAAPTELHAEAVVYLQLVRDRANLVAGYGYVAVQQLPADVRTAFIAAHQDEQLIANRLIDFTTSTCGIG